MKRCDKASIYGVGVLTALRQTLESEGFASQPPGTRRQLDDAIMLLQGAPRWLEIAWDLGKLVRKHTVR